jgi:hypothetical protein
MALLEFNLSTRVVVPEASFMVTPVLLLEKDNSPPVVTAPAKVALPEPSNASFTLLPGDEPVPICRVAALVPPFLI